MARRVARLTMRDEPRIGYVIAKVTAHVAPHVIKRLRRYLKGKPRTYRLKCYAAMRQIGMGATNEFAELFAALNRKEC